LDSIINATRSLSPILHVDGKKLSIFCVESPNVIAFEYLEHLLAKLSGSWRPSRCCLNRLESMPNLMKHKGNALAALAFYAVCK